MAAGNAILGIERGNAEAQLAEEQYQHELAWAEIKARQQGRSDQQQLALLMGDFDTFFAMGGFMSKGSLDASSVLGAVGKVWNLPNTVIGLIYGGAARLFGGEFSFGNGHNAMVFTDSPWIAAGAALTLGNVIIAGSGFSRWPHEQVHTVQGQYTGLFYIPLNLIGMGLSLLSSPIPGLRREFESPVHGRLNIMEGSPFSDYLYGEGS